LIEKYDFEITFLITAAVKALSFAPLLLLLCLLEQEQQSQTEGQDVEAMQAGLLSPSTESDIRSDDDIQHDYEPPVLSEKVHWQRVVRLDWQTPEVHVLGDTIPDGGHSPCGPLSMCSDHHSESGG
jgi:hypothetical protein